MSWQVGIQLFEFSTFVKDALENSPYFVDTDWIEVNTVSRMCSACCRFENPTDMEISEHDIRILRCLLRPLWGSPLKIMRDLVVDRLEQSFDDFAAYRMSGAVAFYRHPAIEVVKAWFDAGLHRKSQTVRAVRQYFSQIKDTRRNDSVSAMHLTRQNLATLAQYIGPNERWEISCMAPEVCPVVFGATIYCRAGQRHFELPAAVWMQELGPFLVPD